MESPARAVAGGSHERRVLLERALASIGYAAWNREAEHANVELRAVDLICGPIAERVGAQGRIAPSREGLTLSDHAGYWVELDVAPDR